MRTKLAETTALWPLGAAGSRALFKIPSGTWRGRMIAVVKTTPLTLAFYWADRPYLSWNGPITIWDSCDHLPFDAVMTLSGDVYIAYSATASTVISATRLTFSDGEWVVGDRVEIYDQYPSSAPSIAVGIDGQLWVAFARAYAAAYDLCVKTSTDGGTTWGSGETDPGNILSSGLQTINPRVVLSLNEAHVLYAANSDSIRVQSRSLAGGSWSDSYTIAGETDQDHSFDAAVSDDGLLGLVFGKSSLKYCDYNGYNWSAPLIIDDLVPSCPQLCFVNQAPTVIYTTESDEGQSVTKYSRRETALFSTPLPLVGGANILENLKLYDSQSGIYADLTTAAASSTTGDVFHPQTNALVAVAGDMVYAGMADRFRYLRIILSTAGSGGTAAYSYFNGSDWVRFIPAGGEYNLNNSDHQLMLWSDLASIPSDWQKRPVDGVNNFWVRIEVLSTFTGSPVASQMTAMSNLKALNLRR